LIVISQALEENKNENLSVDSFVLVKFFLNKRERFYIGQILEKIGDTCYSIKFLRHKKKGRFYWPIVDDVSQIFTTEIVMVMAEPKRERRGILIFDLKLVKFVIS